jgi:serine/threonine protein phosphatase 1
MRTLILGDIHGAYLALIDLIEKVRLQPQDKLIFLGDYVDGWSDSFQVIDKLIELDKTNSCIFIRGNHDVWCHDWLRSKKINETWYNHGGKSTIKSYENANQLQKSNHLDFFAKLEDFVIDENNNLFIHAGYSSMHGPTTETHTSNYSWDRTLWEMAVTMNPRIEKDAASYPKRLKLFKEIFIGHTPTLEYNETLPMHRINVWNIDTGAGFKGKLSAISLETKEIWQSETVQELYPNELGRNKN